MQRSGKVKCDHIVGFLMGCLIYSMHSGYDIHSSQRKPKMTIFWKFLSKYLSNSKHKLVEMYLKWVSTKIYCSSHFAFFVGKTCLPSVIRNGIKWQNVFNDSFWNIRSKLLLKMWYKEKLLIIIHFSFSHNIKLSDAHMFEEHPNPSISNQNEIILG